MAERPTQPTRRTDDRTRPTRRASASDRYSSSYDRRARTTARDASPSRRTRSSDARRRGTRPERQRATGPLNPATLRLLALLVLIGLLVFAVTSCVRSCSSSDGDEPAASAETQQAADASSTEEAATDGEEGEGATAEPAPEPEPVELPTANSEAAIENPAAFKHRLLTSTPRDQWANGTVPLILQKDPQWATTPYADGVIGTHGCGPTALAMAYVHLTGDTSYDPVKMCAFSEEMGYVEAGVTGWRLMDEGAANLGLTVHPVITTVEGLRQALEAGQVLVQDCDPGDFTEHGHFIVIVGIDENDQLEIRDPNSWRNTQKPWDAQRVLDQHRNIWGFSYEG